MLICCRKLMFLVSSKLKYLKVDGVVNVFGLLALASLLELRFFFHQILLVMFGVFFLTLMAAS